MPDNHAPGYRFAYQPILNADQASVGIELQFDTIGNLRDDPTYAAFTAADAIIHAFIHAGLDDLLRHRRAWIEATGALLGSGLIDLLPAAHFALRVNPDDPLLTQARLMQLRLDGFLIALDGPALVGHPDSAALLQIAHVVAFDANDLASPEVRDLLASLRGSALQLLARHVDKPEEFTALLQAGFHLFQGYHFAHRDEAAGARVDPRKLTLLDLIGRLAADADDRDLEEAFRADPALSLHLLRLVNSSAFAVQSGITSIKHAFAVLGRRQLLRWLQVLLYALDGDGKASPLMELALRRARFIEYSLKYLHHRESSQLQDEAYMTGLLSLADVLIGWPLEKVAEKLRLAEPVRAALVDRQGTLGRLIDLVEALEQAEFNRATECADSLHLTEDAVIHIQNVAMSWATAVAEGRSVQEQSGEDAAEQNGDQAE